MNAINIYQNQLKFAKNKLINNLDTETNSDNNTDFKQEIEFVDNSKINIYISALGSKKGSVIKEKNNDRK
jgi:hypothetical protein